MHSVTVLVGIDGNRLDTGIFSGSNDSDSDLTAVSNEDFGYLG
jgi:hypothetical protein